MAHSHTGRCVCGQVRFEFSSSKDLPDQSPRQCDCDYCATHGKPTLLSDPEGELVIISDKEMMRESQGSGQVEMLFCPNCGNTVGACLNDSNQTIGVINGRLLNETDRLPTPQTVSPKHLSPEEKRIRWHSIWTPTTICIVS